MKSIDDEIGDVFYNFEVVLRFDVVVYLVEIYSLVGESLNFVYIDSFDWL